MAVTHSCQQDPHSSQHYYVSTRSHLHMELQIHLGLSSGLWAAHFLPWSPWKVQCRL